MVGGGVNKIWFWFWPQMVLSASSPNLLNFLIPKYNFVPFQSIDFVFCSIPNLHEFNRGQQKSDKLKYFY